MVSCAGAMAEETGSAPIRPAMMAYSFTREGWWLNDVDESVRGSTASFTFSAFSISGQSTRDQDGNSSKPRGIVKVGNWSSISVPLITSCLRDSERKVCALISIQVNAFPRGLIRLQFIGRIGSLFQSS